MTEVSVMAANESVDNWADDVLKRKNVSVDFTNILLSLPTPHVVSINAEYGMGKSFFVDRWAKDLKQSGHTVLSFNAWENDFSDDPLMAFVVDLQEQLSDLGLVNKTESAMKELVKSAGRIGFQVIVSTAEAATLNSVDISQINKQEKADALKKKYGDFAEAKINAHLEVKKGIEQFKISLGSVAEKIKKKDAEKGLPIIVFIDELDRCRPDFAVQLLENIKHIYSVENYIFVLSMDRAQMRHAVGVIYGQGMDGEGYLRRFIDLELGLPSPNTKAFSEFLWRQSKLEISLGQFRQHDHLYDPSYLSSSFAEYSEFFGLTLREQEQVFREMIVAIRQATSFTRAICPTVLGFLAALKAKNKDLYKKIGVSLTDLWDVVGEIESFTGRVGYHAERVDRRDAGATLCFLAAVLLRNRQEAIAKLERILEQRRKNQADMKENPLKLDRDHTIYSEVIKISDGLEREGLCQNRVPPILHLKRLLDLSSSYSVR